MTGHYRYYILVGGKRGEGKEVNKYSVNQLIAILSKLSICHQFKNSDQVNVGLLF